jgi:hypothetical protein
MTSMNKTIKDLEAKRASLVRKLENVETLLKQAKALQSSIERVDEPTAFSPPPLRSGAWADEDEEEPVRPAETAPVAPPAQPSSWAKLTARQVAPPVVHRGANADVRSAKADLRESSRAAPSPPSETGSGSWNNSSRRRRSGKKGKPIESRGCRVVTSTSGGHNCYCAVTGFNTRDEWVYHTLGTHFGIHSNSYMLTDCGGKHIVAAERLVCPYIHRGVTWRVGYGEHDVIATFERARAVVGTNVLRQLTQQEIADVMRG